MREIKFRAWDKSRKEMESIDDMYWFEENGVDDINDNVFLEFMQYTGLKDKNGVEIYEGDVVLSSHGQKGEVYWSENDFSYLVEWKVEGYTSYLSRCRSCELIGNIYENPELLEVAE